MSTTTTNNNVPGLLLPTIKAPLAGSPGASAMAARNNQTQQQALLATAVGGRRKMKKGANKKGGAIIVPQMSGDTSGANAVIAQNAGNSVQATANAKYDATAMKKGGTKRKKGGNPNWLWGCYSGVRKKSKRRTIKRRKTRRNKK
jgi:hypothetical protein